MIKAMGNDPTLLLRVIAGVLLDRHRERLPPKMSDSQGEFDQAVAEDDHQYPP